MLKSAIVETNKPTLVPHLHPSIIWACSDGVVSPSYMCVIRYPLYNGTWIM